jgi:hypothetical protein
MVCHRTYYINQLAQTARRISSNCGFGDYCEPFHTAVVSCVVGYEGDSVQESNRGYPGIRTTEGEPILRSNVRGTRMVRQPPS